MLDFRDMLGRVGELESDSRTVTADRKAPALYGRNLVWHIGVDRIVRNGVDPRLRHDFAWFVFLRRVPVLFIFAATSRNGRQSAAFRAC